MKNIFKIKNTHRLQTIDIILTKGSFFSVDVYFYFKEITSHAFESFEVWQIDFYVPELDLFCKSENDYLKKRIEKILAESEFYILD